ncbi:MAG TPA: hypothetical protein VLW17_05040 [Thermoanaerobaculaceae bacterium]|nr:hypothetical protein [Thermoanaerobaculaceae bacterium]
MVGFLLVALLGAGAASTPAPAQSAAPAANAPAPAADAWAAMRFLLGDWVGEGGGDPGSGSGSFSFRFDLGEKVIVRRDHSEYPRGGGAAPIVHDGLMVVYPETEDGALAAVYFDNEGHVIRYRTQLGEGGQSVVFLSEAAPSSPRFRLAYSRVDEDTVEVRFSIAPPGRPDAFELYLGGRCRRVRKG